MSFKKLNFWNWFKKENEDQIKPATTETQPSNVLPMIKMHRDIDRLFEDFWHGFGPKSFDLSSSLNRTNELSAGLLKPKLDIESQDQEYLIKVELPGVDDSNLHLEVNDHTLVLRGEKTRESEHKKDNYYHSERVYGSFQRVLDLPEDADPDKISASHKNGVLTITIDKRPIEKKSIGRKIEVVKLN